MEKINVKPQKLTKMQTKFQLKSQELNGYSPADLYPYGEYITTHLIPQEDWATANTVRYFEIDLDILFNLYMDYLCQFGSQLDKLTEDNKTICSTEYEELLPDYILQLLAMANQLNCQESCKATINRYLNSHSDAQDLASDAGIEL